RMGNRYDTRQRIALLWAPKSFLRSRWPIWKQGDFKPWFRMSTPGHPYLLGCRAKTRGRKGTQLVSAVRMGRKPSAVCRRWNQKGRESYRMLPKDSQLGLAGLPDKLLDIGLDRLAPDVVALGAQVQVVRHDLAR